VRQSRLDSRNPASLRHVERWLEQYRVLRATRLQDLESYVETGATTRHDLAVRRKTHDVRGET
jgi:hypothetical protein